MLPLQNVWCAYSVLHGEVNIIWYIALQHIGNIHQYTTSFTILICKLFVQLYYLKLLRARLPLLSSPVFVFVLVIIIFGFCKNCTSFVELFVKLICNISKISKNMHVYNLVNRSTSTSSSYYSLQLGLYYLGKYCFLLKSSEVSSWRGV